MNEDSIDTMRDEMYAAMERQLLGGPPKHNDEAESLQRLVDSSTALWVAEDEA